MWRHKLENLDVKLSDLGSLSDLRYGSKKLRFLHAPKFGVK